MAMVFEKMQEALAQKFDIEIDEITRDTDLMEDLEADSLDLVELITLLEEEYDISVEDDSVFEHTTIGAIADFIESLIAAS